MADRKQGMIAVSKAQSERIRILAGKWAKRPNMGEDPLGNRIEEFLTQLEAEQASWEEQQ